MVRMTTTLSPATEADTPSETDAQTETDAASGAAAATPPSVADIAWFGAIAAAKAAVVALAVDAFLNADTPRFSGKGMRVRAVGYAGSLLVVPVVWRLRGRQDPYPRELDLAVTLPLLGDAAGNAVGIYQRAHVDDAIHFANGAILASVVGALVTPRTQTSWEAAGIAAATGTSAATAWEIAEWVGLKLGARGMNLSYATRWLTSSRRAPARCSAASSRCCATPPASVACRVAAPTPWCAAAEGSDGGRDGRRPVRRARHDRARSRRGADRDGPAAPDLARPARAAWHDAGRRLVRGCPGRPRLARAS